VINEIRNYQDFHKDEIFIKIRNEVEHEGESRGWHGARKCPGHYQEVCAELLKEGIVPLEDMFGSWGKQEQHKPEYEHFVTVKFLMTAESADDALDKWANGDYDSHEVQDYGRESSVRKDVHIIYSVDKHGVIKYNCTDGSSGSTPNMTEEQFQKYWSNHYKNKKVTFERTQ